VGEVIEANIATTVDLPADKILEAAMGHALEDTLVIGWGADGKLYFSSTTSNVAEVIYLLEAAKFSLLKSDDA
jgi:hypothetical protein